MKKQLVNTLFWAVIGLILFQACQEDPIFPDPGFEISDQRVEIRRDTADFYDIKFKMNVPNGVDNIELLNATDYMVLDDISGYEGKTKFDFNYRVDLTPFPQDTVLNYIIKVIDQDRRSTNQGIRMDVKGFSKPEIRLVGGTNISVAAPAFVVKGIASAGLNTIETISISFEGKEQYHYEAPEGELVYEKIIKELIFLGNLDANKEYYLDIVITDDIGQTSTTTITVRKNDTIKKPVKVNYLDSGLNTGVISIEFSYDANNELSALDYRFQSGTNYHSEYSYNSLNMLDTLKYRSYASDGTYSRDTYYYYNYEPGTKKLISIESQEFDNIDGNISIGNIDTERSEFVYDATGTKVLSFRRSNTVSNIYYSDPFNLGENIYGEYWQTESIMSATRNDYRQHRTDYDPVLIPTYTESIPPFEAPTGVMFSLYNDLFWHKYMMTRTVATDENTTRDLRAPAYTYETDADGNITSIVKTYTGGGSQYEGRTVTYSFFY